MQKISSKKRFHDIFVSLFCFNAGGSGFLGQHIIKHLQENDDEVKEIRVVDLKPYKNNLRTY